MLHTNIIATPRCNPSAVVYAYVDPHIFVLFIVLQVIGNTSDPTAATTEQFKEFWTELARRFVLNPRVVFGINNEPHDMVGCPQSYVLLEILTL